MALPLKEIPAARAAQLLRSIYPDARITTDAGANAVIVIATPAEVDQIRSILNAVDTRDPRKPTADVVHLNASDPASISMRMEALYPGAKFEAGPNGTLLILAGPSDMDQIKAIIADIDVPAASKSANAVVHIAQANPRTVARLVTHEIPNVRADVSGDSIVLIGSPESTARAKDMAIALDVPPPGTHYVQTYRLNFVDAASVGALLTRTFPDASVTLDPTLNAVTVRASGAEQARIAAGIAQVDLSPGAPIAQAGSSQGSAGPGGTAVEVINLRAATPGLNGTQSTTSSDIAQTVEQALGQQAQDLHITIEPNSTRLVLSGSPYSVKLAKDLIEQLDQAQDLVVLDTQIYEVDVNSAKQLGLTAGTPGSPFLTTTISEYPPQTVIVGASPPPFFGIQPLTRTALSLTLSLSALIQSGNARILADPRITTISGRTATIRAGDNISVLTQTPGGVGVPPTSQIQTFQTGVTLDITPVINEGGFITVNLHPTVNSLSSTNSEGIPQISTRDTQTTVGMRADQTLVIGGLIEDDTTTSRQDVPILSHIPLVGGLFRAVNDTHQRNELVIAVTPHIIHPGEPSPLDKGLVNPTTPAPLPTLQPGMLFPPPIVSSGPIIIPNRTGRTTSAQPYSPQTPSYQPVGVPTPRASLAPGQRPTFTVPDATPTPLTLSTMQGPAGTYTYGAPAANIVAGPSDAATIYYVTVSPSVVKNNTPVTFNATTSTNVARLLLLSGNAAIAAIQQTSPGHWQAAFPFSAPGISPTATTVQLTLTAIKADGTSISIQFPLGYTPCTAPPAGSAPTFGFATPAPC